MKKINLILVILFLSVIYSCKAQQLGQQNNYATEIVGTWYSNDDPLWKITFTNNGLRKDYYENELTETYSYSISNSCNNQILHGEFFLKTTEESSSISCDILNGFHTDTTNGEITMSITSERGKLYLFTKQ